MNFGRIKFLTRVRCFNKYVMDLKEIFNKNADYWPMDTQDRYEKYMSEEMFINFFHGLLSKQ